MPTDKLEPRLATLIDQEKVRASARGATAAAVDEEERFEVTISHHESILAEEISQEEEEDRQAALDELGRRTQQSQQPIVEQLRQVTGDEELKSHRLTNAVTTRLTPAQMERVAELDEVKIIRLEKLDSVTTMNESAVAIEAEGAREAFSVTGKNVRVAVLDSGVDASHPALAGRVVDAFDHANEPVNIPGNHGTHVAGTIASTDAVFRGIAFEADIINIKVLTSAGNGQPQNVIDGLDRAVRSNARVANLSLGWSEIRHRWECDNADCILCVAADNAVRLGVAVVVAAGNEGDDAGPGQFNIRHPGAARRVITVAAVDKAKELASFSSIGPGSARLSSTSPIRITKPDVAGPGVGIMSSVLGGGFASFNGTSMASPHVAGVAALVLQRHPNMKPIVLKKLLEETSEDLLLAPREIGYGLVSPLAALMQS
jgi:subtilisin family serine protease